MPQYCTECGRDNNETSKFCSVCGALLEGLSTAPLVKPATVLDDRYEIISVVKAGGMGCIYKARDQRLKEVVAVKKMSSPHPSPEEQKKAEERFEEEARFLFKLHHNGLPNVSDFFTDKDPDTGKPAHFLIMTFIEGADLETLMEGQGRKPLPVEKVISIAGQILEILKYLHSQDPPLIYRDLNARNVMLKDDKIFLVDFGIARVFRPHQKGTAIGTPGYAAPEQYKGFADPRSDLYSLGVLMHYLLTGIDPEDPSRPPHRFEPAMKINNTVPAALNALVMALLDNIIENRPGSAQKVEELLKTALTDKADTLISHASPAIATPQQIKPVNPMQTESRRKQTVIVSPDEINTKKPQGIHEEILIALVSVAILLIVGLISYSIFRMAIDSASKARKKEGKRGSLTVLAASEGELNKYLKILKDKGIEAQAGSEDTYENKGILGYVVVGSFRTELAKSVTEYLKANNYRSALMPPDRNGFSTVQIGDHYKSRDSADTVVKRLQNELSVKFHTEPLYEQAKVTRFYLVINDVDEKKAGDIISLLKVRSEDAKLEISP
ncbi:MAG: protein kinase [Candidatus Eremiobacteraeota bacterium]|nr:protein kinase [Candidatus Eremiobacteraeota bacterium]